MDYEEAAEAFGLDALHPVDGTAVLLPLDTLRELMAYADASPGSRVASGVYVAHGTGLDGGALAESFVWDNRADADGLHRVPAAIGRTSPPSPPEMAEPSTRWPTRSGVGPGGGRQRMAAALADVRTSLLDHLAELLAPAVDGGSGIWKRSPRRSPE